MIEKYSITVGDETVEIYGYLTAQESIDIIMFFAEKGYNELILGTENSTIHMMKTKNGSQVKPNESNPL